MERTSASSAEPAESDVSLEGRTGQSQASHRVCLCSFFFLGLLVTRGLSFQREFRVTQADTGDFRLSALKGHQ